MPFLSSTDPVPLTLATALHTASACIDRLDARLLLEFVSGKTHAALITEAESTLSPEQRTCFLALVERRSAGEPLAYLTGEAGFYGLPFAVTPAVLIPRPETELLVDLALAALDTLPSAAEILDLGTGSGVLAVTLAKLRTRARVTAIDASVAAIEVARKNAARHGVDVRFLQGHWYAPLDTVRFDLIVANPPYIAAGDPHLERGGLPFEPRSALTDGRHGGDGLACLHEIIAGAPGHLRPGGILFLEHGYDQAEAVRALLAQRGFREVQSRCDLNSVERVSCGCWQKFQF